MAKILYSDFTLPDMRKYRTASSFPQLAAEIYSLNKERIDKNYKEIKQIAFQTVAITTPIELIEGQLQIQHERDPKATIKDIAIRTMNSNTFSTIKERYARNTITMLKNTRKYDELRRLSGWNKGIQTSKFEYDDKIGYMVYDGKWIIYHDEDYYAEDGIEIISREVWDAYH